MPGITLDEYRNALGINGSLGILSLLGISEQAEIGYGFKPLKEGLIVGKERETTGLLCLGSSGF